MIKKVKIGIAIMPVLVLPFISLPALAENSSAKAGSGEARIETHNTVAAVATQTEHPKLEAAKQKVCSNKQNAVNRITANKSKADQQVIDTFDKIATNVENFYQTKNLSSADYAGALANVNAKKDAAQVATDKVKNDQITFKCDGTDHPRSVVEGLQADLKTARLAVHSYHESITNLIKVVKSAKSTTEGAQ